MHSEVIDRINANDPDLVRVDITHGLFDGWTKSQIDSFIQVFPGHPSIKSVHLSGLDLESALDEEQIVALVHAVAGMEQLEDLCVFRGGSSVLNEDLLASCLTQNKNLKVLLLWQFADLYKNENLAGALRQHPTLEIVTITLPGQMPWSCMDVYLMGFCSMKNLKVLQIRCQGKQEDSIFSPEASALLFASTTIQSLYLENVGLLDDHVDVMYEELPKNTTLTLLDIKNNLLSDDALYTFARALPKLKVLKSLDLSGAYITQGAGEAMARGMAQNTVMTHLELEGGEERFADEFDIPVGHSETDWMKSIYFHIRLNRAQAQGSVGANKPLFVEALNSVSDQVDCLYHFLRTYPKHCDRDGYDTHCILQASSTSVDVTTVTDK